MISFNVRRTVYFKALVISSVSYYIYIVVMEWSGRRIGHRQRSQSKSETTATKTGDHQVLLYSSRQFSAHPESLLRMHR